MKYTRIYFLVAGVFFIVLALINVLSADYLSPELLRAETLSCLSSVILILGYFLLAKYEETKTNKIIDNNNQGFILEKGLNSELSNELAWGSNMILTATPAATILVYWDNKIILRRGLLGKGLFTPGPISKSVMEKNSSLSLVNTKYFPGRKEFDTILPNLPSIYISPLNQKGIVIIGGLSDKCFSISDEKWIKGWTNKLYTILIR